MEAWPDVQASAPAVPVSLSRGGVTGVEKVIRIGARGARHPRLYSARLDCYVDLGPEQKGAHMSRFEEVINDAIGQVILGEVGLRAEELAQHIAQRVRERQDALRAEVTIGARYPEYRPRDSGVATQEIYTLYASAVASEHGTRRMAGVAAQGMTTGLGVGTLHIGSPEDCDIDVDAAALLTIVEESMAGDGTGVEKADRRPRFAEDCVREMLRAVLDRYDDLPDHAFVSARQESIETVHRHNVVAERFGLVGELRAERRTGVASPHHTSRREWLNAIGASARPLG